MASKKKSELTLVLEAIGGLYEDSWSKRDVEVLAQWVRQIADKKGDSDV
jgi:hypothetical protein